MVLWSWTQQTLETEKVKIHRHTLQIQKLAARQNINYFALTVFVQLVCAFRYGSDDLDVIGLCFRKDIWIQQVQIYPENHKPALTAMHETLLKKAGDNAYPFSFEVCDV